MKKYFLVEISNLIELPYEESLLDGIVNKNNLMYLAHAAINKKGFSSVNAIYKYRLREIDEQGKVHDIENI